MKADSSSACCGVFIISVDALTVFRFGDGAVVLRYHVETLSHVKRLSMWRVRHAHVLTRNNYVELCDKLCYYYLQVFLRPVRLPPFVYDVGTGQQRLERYEQEDEDTYSRRFGVNDLESIST